MQPDSIAPRTGPRTRSRDHALNEVTVDGSGGPGSAHVTGALSSADVVEAPVFVDMQRGTRKAIAPTLDRLWARGTAFLGCPIAILGGAMSWVSERHLVSAISNAGGFGVIACGSMTPDLLAAEIAATQAMTTKPFGVNLITMHPAAGRSDPRLPGGRRSATSCWPAAFRRAPR